MSDNTPDVGRYPHVVRELVQKPWAILPGKLAAIAELVALRDAGEKLTAEEIQARIGKPRQATAAQQVGHVALVPVYGVMVPRGDLFSEVSGATSTQRITSAVQEAARDGDVSAIVLDIDSPGGSTDLIPELAEEIRRARDTKTVVAVANARAASAAHWIASQASEYVVTPSGDVGSIGVYCVHDDISKLQEKLGVKTTLVSAGKYKVEANPFEPLSDEAEQALQAMVDEFYGMFVEDVAEGRGVSAEVVRERHGQGRLLTAKNALQAGMVDRVETLEATLARLIGSPVATSFGSPPTAGATEARRQGLTFADELGRARTHVVEAVARVRSLAGLREEEGRELSASAREHSAGFQETLVRGAAELAVLLEARQQEPDTFDGVDLELERLQQLLKH